MSQRLPWPKESQPFERLCRDLWAAREPGLRWQLYGRSGEEQRGVDVVGDAGGTTVAAIQCKARDRFLGSTVTKGHVDEWIDAAIDGGLPLQRLILATTAPLQRAIQDHVLARSKANVVRGGFAIEHWAWDQIEGELWQPAHLDVLAAHWPQFRFRSEEQQRLVRYLDQLVPDLQDLGMQWLRDRDGGAANAAGRGPRLEDVYTMLDVDRVVDARGPDAPERAAAAAEAEAMREAPRWTLPSDPCEVGELVARLAADGEDDEDGEDDKATAPRPATILEAAAVNPRLLLTGVGGSGKSAFARFLALCLAGERLAAAGRSPGATLATLTSGEPARWTHGMLVPLVVDLRAFAKSAAFPGPTDRPTRQRLWDFLHDRLPDGVQSQLEELLAERHAVDGVLLVLDGLDEIPEREQRVPRLLAVLDDFLRQHPRCRVLLTARPYAADDPAVQQTMRRLGFAQVGLAPPGLPTMRRFLQAWFAPRPDGAATAGRMIALLDERPRLREILRTPLILTLVAMLYAEGGGANWHNRADVFERAVDRLVDRWNAGRGIDGAELLAPVLAPLHRALEELAWHVLTEKPADAERDRWFGRALLERVLRTHGIQEAALQQKLPLYLQQRCGIIDHDGGEAWRFAHKNLLEFLAARFATRGIDHPLPLLENARKNLGDWREVVLFAGALGARGAGVGVFTLLDHAVPAELPDDAARDDVRWPLLAACAEIVVEHGLMAPARAADRQKLDRLRKWLQRCIDVGALPIRERALVGRWLAAIGDRRRGVGLRPDGVPDVDWVVVPCGRRELRVARYPVTVAQYEAFVRDGGYTAKWDECWTDEGRAWRDGRTRLEREAVQGPKDYDSVFQTANHPRIGVCLHEAVAFAAWLARSAPEHQGARLPMSDEWRMIARGQQGRAFPWGDAFARDRCNSSEAGIGATSAVGMFPAGASPEGVHDLAGNAYEWARRPKDPAGAQAGDLRGGAWLDDADVLRIGFDRFNVPGSAADDRGDDVGFRVVAPASR